MNKNDLKDDIIASINNYQRHFNPNLDRKSVKDIKVIKRGRQHEGLKQVITNSISNGNSATCILYGFQGYGRKSCVYGVLNDLEKTYPELKIIFITLDAYIHNTEKNFVNTFLQRLREQSDIIDPKLTKSEYQDAFSFKKLNDILQTLDCVLIIMIEHLEELATIKKQVLLYSFLDWIQNNKNNVVLIGLTTNMVFTDLLEKRVRSRLSSNCFYFYDYDFDLLQEILHERLKMNSIKYINDYMGAIMRKEDVIVFYKELYSKKKSIEEILKISCSAMCYIEIGNLSMNYKNDVIWTSELRESLEAAYDCHRQSVSYSLGLQLLTPELLVLIAVKKLIENFNETLNIDMVYKEIEKYTEESNVRGIGTNLNFSKNITAKAISNLIDMNILRPEVDNEEVKKIKKTNLVLNMPVEEVDEILKIRKESLPSSLFDYSKTV